MKEKHLTGSILKIVSDINIEEDLQKTEGKSIASLLNDSEKNNQKENSDKTEQRLQFEE